MFAVIVNTIAILVGCSIGLLLRKGIPETMSDALMKGLGLCTVVIGIQGAVREQDILLLSMAEHRLSGNAGVSDRARTGIHDSSGNGIVFSLADFTGA